MTTHRCLSCAAGPDRLLDHERAILTVPRGYRGRPESMHGGAAAGLVVCLGDAHLAGPTVRFNVRLHAPPPSPGLCASREVIGAGLAGPIVAQLLDREAHQ